MNKQVIDFRASKGITVAQSNEHQRNRSEKAAKEASRTGNYDPTREHLNFEVTRGGKIQAVDKSNSIPQRMAESLARRGIRDPNEGLAEPRFRTVVNFILGGSRERMNEMAFGSQLVDFSKCADNSHISRHEDIEKWAQDMYRFFAERYGEENIIGCYVHLDELNAHIHLTLLPIDEDNKFAFKKIFAGKDKFEFRQKTQELHDALAEVNAKWGLARGSDIHETGARHRTTEEYRRELNDACREMERMCFSLEEEISNLQSMYFMLTRELSKADRRVKGLKTMIDNLTSLKQRLEQELAALLESKATTLAEQERKEKSLQNIRRELASIKKQLDDKSMKLTDADAKLDAVKAELKSITDKRDNLRLQVNGYKDTVRSHDIAQMGNVLADVLVNESREILPKLSIPDLKLFDGTLLNEMAERG